MDKKQAQADWRTRTPEGYRFLSKVDEEPLWSLTLAEDEAGQKFLLKLFSPVLSGQEELRAEVLSSLAAGQRLSHPNLLPLVALHEQARPLAARFEYRPGTSLRQRVRAQKLTVAEACHIGLQVAMALQHCHQKGFVQGLLMPSSVYLDQDGNALVHEVALARLAGLVLERGAPNIRAHFASFMSPEQLVENGQATFLSDVYILGLLLYELLAGRAAFLASSASEVVALQTGSPPVGLQTLNSAVPDGLVSVVARCLEKDPQRRFSSCAEVMDALEAQLLSLPGAKRRPRTAQKRAPHPGLKRITTRHLRGLAVGALVVGVFAAGALLVSHRSAERGEGRHKGQVEEAPPEPTPVGAQESVPEVARDGPISTSGTTSGAESSAVAVIARPAPVPPAVLMVQPQVAGTPVEAEVFVDGTRQGKAEAGTGLMLQLSPEKRHIVRLSRPGYQPWDTTVVLRPGEGKNIAAELYPEPDAFVEVTLGQVDFARFVRVDEAGEARPLPTTLRLSVGRHVLSYLDAEGNPMWRTVQVFDPSGPREFTPRVELQFAEVAVVVENAAEVGYAYVFIDGQEWKSGTTSATPMRTLVPAGQHRVRLVRDGFRAVPTDTTVLLAPGERVRLGFKLFPAR